MTGAVLLFLLGFVLLIKGGDWFVSGAAGIARRFRLPELLIGATIVSIGTTLPEVMVSLGAALKGSSGISYGNAIGSVICNTSLIAAITIAVRPEPVRRDSLVIPTMFFFIAAVFYSLNALIQGGFTRTDGVILLGLFAVYMVLTVSFMRRQRDGSEGAGAAAPGRDEGAAEACTAAPGRDEGSAGDGEGPGSAAGSAEEALSGWKGTLAGEIVLLAAGAVLIAIGADLLVDNGVLIAGYLGVPESVIGLTMVALGTSLPELVTAITSLVRGHGALSLGNVIGANLFNLVLVAGLSVTIAPFSLPSERLIAGINSSLLIDLPLMLIVMGILTVPALLKGRLYRWQGIALLAVYAAFTAYQLAV